MKDREDKGFVQLDSAREIYQTAIGAHPDQGYVILFMSRYSDKVNLIPRGGLSGWMLDVLQPLEASWKGLGLTPTTYSAGDLFYFDA